MAMNPLVGRMIGGLGVAVCWTVLYKAIKFFVFPIKVNRFNVHRSFMLDETEIENCLLLSLQSPLCALLRCPPARWGISLNLGLLSLSLATGAE
eukprot:1487140-Rhodomonas_salina.4